MNLELQAIRACRETIDESGLHHDIITKREVCPECNGAGSNSRNMGAFSGDEMDEMGDEFRQDYIAGHYNQQCEGCKGLRVVEVLDREKTDDRVVALVDGTRRDLEGMYEEEARERRYGA